MNEEQLNRAKEILRAADKNFADIDWDFVQSIFDKMVCEDCPAKDGCKCYEEIQRGEEDLTEDCAEYLYNWMITGKSDS